MIMLIYSILAIAEGVVRIKHLHVPLITSTLQAETRQVLVVEF